MALAHITANTTQEYPCTLCGNLGNIIREGANPRVKCNTCGFVYDGVDSLKLKEEGALPDGPPEEKVDSSAPVSLPNDRPDIRTSRKKDREIKPQVRQAVGAPEILPLVQPLPRNPSHVILSKDRRFFDFVTDKTFKRKVLEWEASNRTYDVFSLEKMSYTVNIDIK